MFWSRADFRLFSDSAGLTLLSNGTISNFTPAGLFLLNSSARYWKLFSWFWPMGAIRPDSGSIQAILTVSPFCANAAPGCSARQDRARAAASARGLVRNVMSLSPMAPRWFAVACCSTVTERGAIALRDYPERACRPRDSGRGRGRRGRGRRRQHVVAELLAQPELLQLAGGGMGQLGHHRH